MRLHHEKLPLAAFDTEGIDEDDNACRYEYCVDTRLPNPNTGDNARPYFDRPVNSMPRVPCECEPAIQRFEDLTFQLTCNITVDPCHFEYGKWYISLELPEPVELFNTTVDLAAQANYTIAAVVVQPSVTRLFRNVTFKGFVEPERATHYRIEIPEANFNQGGSHLLVHVSNIRGGSLDINVHRGQGVGANLAGGREGCLPANATCRSSDACNLVIEKCHLIPGTYYISLEVSYVQTGPNLNGYFLIDDVDRLPLTFTVRADWMDDPAPQRLLAGVPVHKFIGEALYDFYVVDVPATVDTWMYVELFTQAKDTEVILAMLHGAIPGGECYERPDFYCLTGDARALEIPTGNPQNLIDRPLARETCSFMIQTCELEAGPLYLSVYGHHVGYNPYGDNTFYQIPVQYTLWVDFDVALAVQSAVSYSEHVFENQYQHYYIRADQVNEGSSLSVEVTNIQHGIPQTLEVFINYNFLAGNCPCYDHLYNCTGSRQPSCGGVVASEEPNFLPDPDTLKTCCTIVVPPCDFRSGVWYIAVLGVNEDVVQYTTPIGYTMTATVLPAPKVEPLILGQVEADEVTQWNVTNEYKHYKLAASPLPLNDLVIQLSYVQNCEYKPKHDNLRDTLTVYVNSKALASSECYRYTCSANIQSESFCTIVVPHCEWDAEDWFVSVQGNFDAVFPGRYSLRANVEEVRDTALRSGVTVYGRVSYDRYQHYYIDLQNDETRFLLVEIYTNADQDEVNAYLNIDQRAGGAPCYDAWEPYVCSGASSCSWQLEGCDIRYGRYYVSVHGAERQFYDISVEYALTATLKASTVRLGEGDPLTGHVLADHTNHYQFTVSSVQPGQFLLFEVENVKHGVVAVYINHGSLAGRCTHCDTYLHSDSCVADSDNDASGDKNWCELRVPPCLIEAGEYYFSVVGVEHKTPDGNPLLLPTAIGYTLEVNLVDGSSQEPVVETFRSLENQLTAQFIANGRYRHYAFEVSEADFEAGRQVIVEITRIREGALFAYYNPGTPADEFPECHKARICSTADMSVGGSCFWQMPYCMMDEGRHFISIEGITGRLQASYSILIWKQDPVSLVANPAFAGLTSERDNNISPANTANITHAYRNEPNGWAQFIRLEDVTISDAQGDILELFFFGIENNPGASTLFEVYLYPGEPAGPGDCCDSAPGSCQTFPCLRRVRQFTQVLGDELDTTDAPNRYLCGHGENSTEPGFEGFRCNVTVSACDLAAAQADDTQTWWATVVPVASSQVAESFDLDGLSYRVSWRVRNTRVDGSGVVGSSTSLNALVNTGDYTQFYEMDVYEDYRAFNFDVDVPNDVHKRVVVQTDYDDGTSSSDAVVYVSKDGHALPYCNDNYICSAPNDCDCSGRYVSPSCCVAAGTYHVTVRNKRDDRDQPIRFRFRITVITESAVVAIPASSSASSPFVTTGSVLPENYNHYEILVGESAIDLHSSLVVELQKTGVDANELVVYARSGRIAGNLLVARNNVLFPRWEEGCHMAQYSCVASGSADDSDEFDLDGRCVLQIPYCQLERNRYFISVYHPDFFQNGTCIVEEDPREYQLSVYFDNTPRALTLGQDLIVPDTAPVGLRSGPDSSPTYVHYFVDVTAADIAYDPRDLALGYYTRFLRFELCDFTVGTANLAVQYDDLAGVPFERSFENSCLDSFGYATDCAEDNCVVDVSPCDGVNEDYSGIPIGTKPHELNTGRYYVAVQVPVLAAFTLRATVLTNNYNELPSFTESGDGHRSGTENVVYEVQPDLLTRFNRTEFRYFADTRLDGTDDDDDLSGRDYFIANLTVISEDLSPSVTLNMWRDDCSRWSCTVNSVNGSCVIDAITLATCSSKGGRYYFRVDAPVFQDHGTGFHLAFYHNESTVQAIRNHQTITEIVYPHEYEEYFYDLSNVGSAKTLAVSIQAACGDLEAWIQPSERAGPTGAVVPSTGACNVDYCRTSFGSDARELDTSTATCQLFLDSCDLEYAGYWIGVRGIATEFPSAANENLYLPIKYHIRVDETVIDTTTSLYPSLAVAHSHIAGPDVAPKQYVFDFETHNVGAMLRFSMRLPNHLVGVVDAATLSVSRNRAVGYTAPCENLDWCTIESGSRMCWFVVSEQTVAELSAAKVYVYADAPFGTEVLVERFDPVIPAITPFRPYAATVAGPDVGGWQLPWSVPRQYYRIDVDPTDAKFFMRARLSDVQHGVVRMWVNGVSADYFGPAASPTGSEWFNNECAYVEDSCTASVSKRDCAEEEWSIPPRTFFVTIEGVEQECELHAIQYTLVVEDEYEPERLAINAGPACDSVDEDEYVHYRLSPRAIESPQQSVLSIRVADVDVNNPEEVRLIVNDGALATEECNLEWRRSDVFVGSATIDYVCGYEELYLAVQGLRSGADAVAPSTINYNIEVVKSLVDVIELEDDIGKIVADEYADFSDDEDSCAHARNFFHYTAVAANDAASYLDVEVRSNGFVHVFLNEGSFAGEGCNVQECFAELQDDGTYACIIREGCDFRSGDYYVTVESEEEYSIIVKTVSEVTPMSLGSPQRGRVAEGEVVFYSLDISESNFNVDSRLVVEISDLYYGNVFASIQYGSTFVPGGDDNLRGASCAAKTAWAESFDESFRSEILGYNTLVVGHEELQSGTYYIGVSGDAASQDCHSIRFTLRASVQSLGIVPEPLAIGDFAQPSPQLVTSRGSGVDLANPLGDKEFRFYQVTPESTGSSAFGQIRVANVADGVVRLFVKKGHLPDYGELVFPGDRRGLDSDFFFQGKAPAAGSRPNTVQVVGEGTFGPRDNYDYSCSTEESSEDHRRGCNIVIDSCDWTSGAVFYVAVQAVSQDFRDKPVSFDVTADEYRDFRLLSPDTPATQRFQSGNFESHFYGAQQTEQESVRIRAQVTQGDSVTVTVSDSRCEALATYTRSMYCSSNYNNDAYMCDLEIPTRAAHPGEHVRTFYVTVTGKNATYTIAYWRQRQNCHEFKGDGSQDGLDFCAGLVPYTVWRWNHYETLDNEAHGTFLQLYDHFRVQPCWSGVTPECNQTLQRFACYESFKRCDRDGFYVGTCRKACEMVEYECVNHFETVNLEALNCNSGRYLDETTEPCTGHREEEPLSNNVFLNDVNVILFETYSSGVSLVPSLFYAAVSALIIMVVL
eukprot:TRINITY_DN4488_c0_g1_i1.p1 TRINITY_DN4488_c0_g1~~TRINITY_DN4488_c0_g1_i1.p1  ORF type:complete len:3374 (+),score=1336.04 TRINITY_DN4488_c0_g1_i1:745-10122(+)